MSDKKDPSGADLPPGSKITDTEYFMESHAEEIVDFMEKRLLKILLLHTRFMTDF